MQRRFTQTGLLALNPQAFNVVVEAGPPERSIRVADGVAIVDVQGPLVHHAGGWPDSYEAIVDRVTEALATDARTVVMVVDSPGGDLHGCFDAARTIRERARSAGKPLVAWITGNGCSGAYALASAADSLQVSASACVGSIGIMHTRTDTSQLDQQMGIGYALVTSGRRKADGNPHTAITAQELAVAQAQVDSMAGLFFDLVSTLRAGKLTPDGVRALDAGTFVGTEAVALGLADGMASDLAAAVAAGGGAMADEERTEEEEAAAALSSSQQDIDDARAALERAAADGSAAAAKALEALDAEEAEEDEDEESDTAAAGAESTDSASASPAAATSAAAATVSAAAAGDLAGRFDAMAREMAELRAERDGARLSALLSTRKDLTREMRAFLRTRSYADAKGFIDRLPKPAVPQRAAGTVVQGTLGATLGAHAVVPSPETADLDRAFGLTAGAEPAVKRAGTSLTFSTPMAQHRRVPPAAAPAATTTTPPAAAPAGQRTGNGGSR